MKEAHTHGCLKNKHPLAISKTRVLNANNMLLGKQCSNSKHDYFLK